MILTKFVNFLLQTRIDRLQGADPASLESKVRQYYGTEDAGEEDNAVAGHVSNLNFEQYYLGSTVKAHQAKHWWTFDTLQAIFKQKSIA